MLVTGGAGYVGSHCCKAFAAAGWEVVTLDNLSRGFREAVRWGPLVEADVADQAATIAAISKFQPDVIAHFAAYAYVAESVVQPDIYYRNNSVATLALLDAMRAVGARRLLFSSTCATYGHPISLPMDEAHPQVPINAYGWSKLIVERMLEDYARAFGLSTIALRYFNAAGCDPDGDIGESHDPETHAIPLAIAAALTKTGSFEVFGTDLQTRDGSAIRDYVHVTDLAEAHVLAAKHLMTSVGADAFNLGTGAGTTVLEIVNAVNRATGSSLEVRASPPRAGDPPVLVASATKALKSFGWTPKYSAIDFIVETALNWQTKRMEL